MPKPPDNSRAVAVRPEARLKKPSYLNDPNDAAYIDDASWQVLTDTTFPTAKDPNVVALAISLCRIRKLDIFRKPYHVVPMWNSLLGREVEQLMPGINELLVTATRTGGFAGNDPPVYGNAITETFVGQRKDKQTGHMVDAQVTLTYPETISITVYRNVEGKRESFTMPIRWREEYQRVGKTELPNEMWSRRTYDQGQKVALAASLRVAFPDVVEPEATDTSINLHGDAQIIENEAQQLPVGAGRETPSQQEQDHPEPLGLVDSVNPTTGEIFVDDPPPADDKPYLIPFIENQDDPREAFMTWARAFAAKVSPLKTEIDLNGWIAANRPMIEVLKERASGIHGTLTTGINKCRVRIANEAARQARG